MQLILLTDYREAFQWKASNALLHGSLDLRKLVDAFSRHGVSVAIREFVSIDLLRESFTGKYVAYTSSEDFGLAYKSYVEDIVMALQLAGAYIIPQFWHLRAHHNKVFAELVRHAMKEAEMLPLGTHVFGCLEEFQNAQINYPAVLKGSSGYAGNSVFLCRTRHEGLQTARRLSRTFTFVEFTREWVKRILRRGYKWRSLHRSKFLVQPFVPNLGGDFKVLVYGKNFFCLGRENRPGDFRASGSGRFRYPEKVTPQLLDFAERVFQRFNCPCASLDIAESDGNLYLLEFQFLCFGTYTIENADHYYIRDGNEWQRVSAKTTPEEEFAASYAGFLKSLASP